MEIISENKQLNSFLGAKFNEGKLFLLINPDEEYGNTFNELLADFDTSNVKVFHVKNEDICEEYEIPDINTTILVDNFKKTQIKFMANYSPSQVLLESAQYYPAFQNFFEKKRVEMTERVKTVLQGAQIICFTKGTAYRPRCKFTRQLLGILEKLGINFGYHNILEDNDMRNWLKIIKNWPTFPQIYVNQELLGGLDSFKKHFNIKDDEEPRYDLIPVESIVAPPQARFENLVKNYKILLISNNVNSEEHKQTADLLKSRGVSFSIYDTVQNQDFSNFINSKYPNSQFPILFADGQEIGDFNIIHDRMRRDELIFSLPQSELKLNQRQKLGFIIRSSPVVVFDSFKDIAEHNQKIESGFLIKLLKANNVEHVVFNLNNEPKLLEIIQSQTKEQSLPLLFANKKFVDSETNLHKFPEQKVLQIIE